MDQPADLLPALPGGRELAASLEHDGYLRLVSYDALVRAIGALWQAGDAFFALPKATKRATACRRTTAITTSAASIPTARIAPISPNRSGRA